MAIALISNSGSHCQIKADFQCKVFHNILFKAKMQIQTFDFRNSLCAVIYHLIWFHLGMEFLCLFCKILAIYTPQLVCCTVAASFGSRIHYQRRIQYVQMTDVCLAPCIWYDSNPPAVLLFELMIMPFIVCKLSTKHRITKYVWLFNNVIYIDMFNVTALDVLFR